MMGSQCRSPSFSNPENWGCAGSRWLASWDQGQGSARTAGRDMHQIDNDPEQRWRDRRYEHALRAKHLDSFREPGSGWILVGTLVLLVLTGVAALFVYLWVSFDLFGDTTHPLEDYWGVALLAWVLTVLGALWLWAHPLPGRLNYVQLLV